MQLRVQYLYIPACPSDIVSCRRRCSASSDLRPASTYESVLDPPHHRQLQCVPLPPLATSTVDITTPQSMIAHVAQGIFPIDLKSSLPPLPHLDAVSIPRWTRVHIHTPTHHIGDIHLPQVERGPNGERFSAYKVLRYLQDTVRQQTVSSDFLRNVPGDVVSHMYQSRLARGGLSSLSTSSLTLSGIDLMFGYTQVWGLENDALSGDYIIHVDVERSL